MKVAVCFSGLTYPDSEQLVKLMKKRFPVYDFFYGTWKGCKSPFENTFYFDEPVIHYHPYLDIDMEEFPIPKLKDILETADIKLKQGPWMNKAVHQTKQIIAHSYMLDNIPEEYDMVIRCRWDLHFYDMVLPIENFIDESRVKRKAIGFSRKLSDKNGPWWSAKGTHRHNWWEGFLMDLLIIHPRDLFDKKRMWQLHEDKKLIAAEMGWYQVLSQPYGDNHDCYFARLGMTSRDGMKQMR